MGKRTSKRGPLALLAGFALCLPSPRPADGQLQTLLVEGATDHCRSGSVPSCSSSVECPPGFVLVGGGVRGIESHIESSYPSSETSWTTTWYRADEVYASAAWALATPWAVCVEAPLPGLELVSGPQLFCNQEAPSCATSLQCPEGKVLLGGGFEGFESKLETSRPSSLTNWEATWYPADDGGEYGIFALGAGRVHVLCADPPPGLELVAASTHTCDHPRQCWSAVSCSEGKVLLGGGLFGLELKSDGAAPHAPSIWLSSWHMAFDEFGFSALSLGAAVALCATGTNDQPLFFADGFDHGDLSLWSSSTGTP